MASGKLIILSAPSGSGKTTICKHLLANEPKLEFSISACSRDKRGNEMHGKDYYFLSVEDFKSKIENNEFLEWEEVYTNKFYGTLKSELQRIWDKGHHVIFDVDVIGGLNIKKQFGDNALALFIMPPSVEELRKRLIARSTDSIENIEIRLKKAKEEIEYASQFDQTIINDRIEVAQIETLEIIQDFLNKE